MGGKGGKEGTPSPEAGLRPGRIGALVRSSNTTVETEFYRAFPEDTPLHTTQLYLARMTPDSIE